MKNNTLLINFMVSSFGHFHVIPYVVKSYKYIYIIYVTWHTFCYFT